MIAVISRESVGRPRVKTRSPLGRGRKPVGVMSFTSIHVRNLEGISVSGSRPSTGQTRKPPPITDGTPRPHGAQSNSGNSTTTVVDDEPSRKALGCRRAPPAVRDGVSQHGRGRVGIWWWMGALMVADGSANGSGWER